MDLYLKQLCGTRHSIDYFDQLNLLCDRERSWRIRYSALARLHLLRYQEILEAIEGFYPTESFRDCEGDRCRELCLLHQGREFRREWCPASNPIGERYQGCCSHRGPMGTCEDWGIRATTPCSDQDMGVHSCEVRPDAPGLNMLAELLDPWSDRMWEEQSGKENRDPLLFQGNE